MAQTSVPNLAQAIRLIDEARTTLDGKSLSDAKNYVDALAQTEASNPKYWYESSRLESYRAHASIGGNDKKNAAVLLDHAIESAQHAITLAGDFAEAHSLLADLYGVKIDLSGFLAGPRFGPKIDAENKRALALAPNSARVYASVGREYLFAPKMFGGDIEKAINSFRKSTQLDPSGDETFVWLALAYRKIGNAAEAEKARSEALRLNPRSVFAQNPPYFK